MGYIASNQIAVFPCGRRNDSVDPAARLTTEFNLVSIINRLVDQKSFVVPISGSLISDDTEIDFNIGGYLFKTTVGNLIDAAESGGNDIAQNGFVVGTINVSKWSSGSDFTSESTYQDLNKITEPNTPSTQALSLDDNNEFVGLLISYNTSDNPPQASDTTLPLLKVDYDGGTLAYSLPTDSLIKFMTNGTHRSVVIDDGDLD